VDDPLAETDASQLAGGQLDAGVGRPAGGGIGGSDLGEVPGQRVAQQVRGRAGVDVSGSLEIRCVGRGGRCGVRREGQPPVLAAIEPRQDGDVDEQVTDGPALQAMDGKRRLGGRVHQRRQPLANRSERIGAAVGIEVVQQGPSIWLPQGEPPRRVAPAPATRPRLEGAEERFAATARTSEVVAGDANQRAS
jgi:hypothetical protein